MTLHAFVRPVRSLSRRLSCGDAAELQLSEWRSAGEPVRLVHGLGSNAATWRGFAAELDARFRPLAIDLRGHGDSSWRPDYGLESFVSDLEVVRDWIGRPFGLIGHSLGGEIALHFAARNPAITRSLVLVDVGGPLPSAGAQRIRADLAAAAGEYASPELYFRELRESHALAQEGGLRELAENGVRRTPGGRYALKLDPALRGRPGTIRRAAEQTGLPGFWEALAQVQCPTLVLRGQVSAVLHADVARRMAATLPAGRLQQIPRAGHAVMLDNPRAFLEAASDFLHETLG